MTTDPNDPFQDIDPEQLATFVQEYVSRESEPDAGTRAVIAAQLRDPRYLPTHVAEMLLSRAEVQAAISVIRKTYKSREIKEVSISTLTADMEIIFQDAKQARQFTAAIAAKKLQAEIVGLINRDINVKVTHKVEEMTTEELMKIVRRAETVIDGDDATDITPRGLPIIEHTA